MRFEKILPSPPLRPYVHSYWLMDSQAGGEARDTLLPTGCPEVVFNVGDATLTSVLGDKPLQNPAVELLGQLTQPCPVRVSGRNALLGIRFYPHTAALFLGAPMREFSNAVADLSAVLGSEMASLRTGLLEDPSLPGRIARVETFLLRRLHRAGPLPGRFGRLESIVQGMLHQPDVGDLATLARRCGVTPRYMEQLFGEFVGISPKLFLRIARFRRSLALLHQSSDSLTGIACASGYFDQSHFIRDFKSFTGLPPSRYVPGDFPMNGLFLKK